MLALCVVVSCMTLPGIVVRSIPSHGSRSSVFHFKQCVFVRLRGFDFFEAFGFRGSQIGSAVFSCVLGTAAFVATSRGVFVEG